MHEWQHICKDGRNWHIPHGELCDRCGHDKEHYDALAAEFESRHGYYPDPNSEEDAEDFAPHVAGVKVVSQPQHAPRCKSVSECPNWSHCLAVGECCPPEPQGNAGVPIRLPQVEPSGGTDGQ